MEKRIFIAVDISEEARQKVAKYISELKEKFPEIKVGWDRPEKLHLTLKFLGETDANQLENLTEIVKKIAGEISNFRLQISETGVFPSPRNARVLWLGVKGDIEIMQKINSFLEIECGKIGFKREKRIYKPHLTIARIREPKKPKELSEIHLENEFEPAPFEVSEIVIYESKLQPAGSIYQKIKSFSFQSP